MTENDYLLAWVIYLVAAFGCLLVSFRLTGWIWRYLREPLRVVAFVLLLSPTVVDPVKDKLAPSIAIVAMDVLLGVGSNALRAVADLCMYGLIVFALYLLFVLIRWPIERWWQGRQGYEPIDENEPTLRDLMERNERDSFESDDGYPRYRKSRIEPRL